MEKKTAAVGVAEIDAEKHDPSSLPPLPPSSLLTPTWSSEPHELNESPTVRILMNIYDAALCLMPLGLIIKIALCITAARIQKKSKGSSLWGADLDPLTLFLSKFNEQLATAFTILFVTVMTTVLRRFALWRAQRGNASVATLEQYHASISLPSTLKTVLSLRAFTLRSLGLVLIWSFYYLGSQASTREFTLSSSDPHQRFPVWSPRFNASRHLSHSIPPKTLAAINGEFAKSIALRYYTKQSLSSTYDLSGDPYVPLLEVSASTKVDEQGWYLWGKNPKVSRRIAGLEALTQKSNKSEGFGLLVGEYETNTTYFDVKCAGLSWSNSSTLNVITTQSLVLTPADDDSARKAGNYSYPRAFNVQSKGVGGISSTSCNISMVSFNVHVECTDGNCAIDKSRPFVNDGSVLSTPHNLSELMYPYFPYPERTYYENGSSSLSPYNASALAWPPLPPRSLYLHSTPFDDNKLFESFLQNFALSLGLPQDNNTSSQLEFVWAGYTAGSSGQGLVNLTEAYVRRYYLLDPIDHPNDYIEVPQVDAISDTVSTAINTYYTLWLKNAIEMDYPIFYNMTEEEMVNRLRDSGNWTISWMDGGEYLPSYRLAVPWIVIDFVSCSILLAGAFIAVVLRHQTLAPDIFGYVSSITRENPNIPLPDGGTSLSGMERARKLKDVRIRIADVSQDGDVGRVGVTVVQDVRSTAAGLQRGRTYL